MQSLSLATCHTHSSHFCLSRRNFDFILHGFDMHVSWCRTNNSMPQCLYRHFYAWSRRWTLAYDLEGKYPPKLTQCCHWWYAQGLVMNKKIFWVQYRRPTTTNDPHVVHENISIASKSTLWMKCSNNSINPGSRSIQKRINRRQVLEYCLINETTGVTPMPNATQLDSHCPRLVSSREIRTVSWQMQACASG